VLESLQHDKIWGAIPRSKFWGDLSPRPPVIYAHDSRYTDQFDSVALRSCEVPGAALTTRVIVRPVGTAHVADDRRHVVLAAGFTPITPAQSTHSAAGIEAIV